MKPETYNTKKEYDSKDHNGGFTLIEMIVSVSIFTVVMFVTVGSLLAIADANRKANALRTTMDNLNFAMEAMARNIRTGSNYACQGAGNCPNGGDSFTYIDQDGVTTTYQHNESDQTIEIKRTNGEFRSITSPEVRIEDVTFFVTNVGTDQRQPFVTISIQGAAGVKQKILTEFSVQTSVSQRRVEG